MRALVFGAGAVGGLAGACLAAAGWQVTLLGRAPVVDAVRRAGLRLTTPDGRDLCLHPAAVTRLDELAGPPPDLVVVTVKAPATEEAVAALSRRFPDPPWLLSLQNGVGNEERLASWAGAGRLVAGALTVSVDSPEPGWVRAHNRGGVGLAAMDGGDGVARRVAAAFASTGLPARLYPDWRALKWSKLCLNLVGNATAALCDRPLAELLGDPGVFHVERRALLEAAAVMRALGLRPVALPGGPLPLLLAMLRWLPEPAARRLLVPRLAAGRGGKEPSLRLDLRRGRAETEVRWLHGAVVAAGRAAGVPTPVNRRLLQLVEDAAGGRLPGTACADGPAGLGRLVLHGLADA